MKKKVKFLLINPPSPELNNPHMNDSYPLGLLYIAAVLENKNVSVKIYDFAQNKDWKKIIKIVQKEKPDVIGLRSLSTNIFGTFKIISLVQKRFPNIKIILGGPHASCMYKQILKRFDIDGVFIGESEKSIIYFLRYFNNKKNYSKIPGFAYIENQKIKVNPLKYSDINIDNLPIPAYHLINLNNYFNQELYFHIVTSRGCPFKCNFCAVPRLTPKYKRHGVKRVISEIKVIQRYNPKETLKLYIHDDLFSLNSKWTENLCKEILKLNFKVKWITRSRAENVSLKTLRLMKKAGCHLISLGVESGSEEILKKMNKKLNIKKIKKSFKLIHSAGIKTHAYIILGYPEENLFTIFKTFKLLLELNPSEISISFPRLIPNTLIYEEYKSKGKINDDYWINEKENKTKNNLPLYSNMNEITLKIYGLIFMGIFRIFKFLKEKQILIPTNKTTLI